MGFSVWVVACLAATFGVVCGTPLRTAAHANDLVKAYADVEEIYREAQPRPPSPSHSATTSPPPTMQPSPSSSTTPSLSPSQTPDPSPSVSPVPFDAPMKPAEVRSRDVLSGNPPTRGKVDTEEERRYPTWWPNGNTPVAVAKAYQWMVKPNRFSFSRSAAESKYMERAYPPNNRANILAFDDPDHLINMLNAGNGTGDMPWVKARQTLRTVAYGEPSTNSRQVGAVHRYLGYVPISKKWTGHPYFDAINREQEPCSFSRSYNCIPVDKVSPQPSPSPSVTVTPSPAPPSRSPTPSVTPKPPEPELDQSELDALAASDPPPFLTAQQADLEPPPPSPQPSPIVLVPTDFDEDDLFPAPEPEPVGEPVPEQPVEEEKVLVMKTVAGGTEASSDYSKAKGEVNNPDPKVDENTATKVEPKDESVPNNPAGTDIN